MIESADSYDDQIFPSIETIYNLFLPGSDKIFRIPQYQRDYSWNMKEGQPQQFFTDIIDRLETKDTEDGPRTVQHPYFIGTMIFTGIWKSNSGSLEVIDGQQRLTTTYLFLGALANRLLDTPIELKEKVGDDCTPEFSKLISDFTRAGSAIRDNRLKTAERPDHKRTMARLDIETGNAIIQSLVFKKAREDLLQPGCQAEHNLIEAYTYMYDKLDIEALADIQKFAKYLQLSDNLYRSYLNYYSLLYGIREQIDTPSVAILCTRTDKQSNEVFESLNSKGKSLEEVDLIKNELFNNLSQGPQTDPHSQWAEIKEGLAKKRTSQMPAEPWIDLKDFFQIYWTAVEGGKGSHNHLYENFQKQYGQADSKCLADFITRAVDFVPDVSALYGNTPLEEEGVCADYLDHAKEGLHCLVYAQKAKQCHPLLASALHASRKGALKSALLVELIDYLSVALLFLKDVRGSKYTSILQDTAHCLANTVRDGYLTKSLRQKMARWYIRNLEDQLSGIIGEVSEETVQEMLSNTGDFVYSNKGNSGNTNAKVRYLLRIRCYQMLCAQKNKGPGTEAAYTWNVEHILPDAKGNQSITHQLGNLLWLDKATNDTCKNKDISEKRKIYRQTAANPEIAKMDSFFSALDGDLEAQTAAITERSKEILYDLYKSVVSRTPTRGSSHTTPRSHTESSYPSSLDSFIEAKGKKYLPYVQKNEWFQTFSSAFVCEEPGENGKTTTIQYPDSRPFNLPFASLRKGIDVEEVESLSRYVESQLKKHRSFRRTDGKSSINILKFLAAYRDYLAA